MDDTITTFSTFGPSFQQKLAFLILDDRIFSDRMMEVLNIEFIEKKELQVFVDKIFSYKKKYGTHPSYDTMETILKSDLECENDVTKKLIRDFYVRVKSDGRIIESAEYVKDQALDFCRKQKLKEAMIKSLKLIKKHSFDEVGVIINDALKAGSDCDFGHDYFADIESRFQPENRMSVTTGWTRFDNIMKGGHGRGELGVAIAPTGAGKTFTLVHLGATALKAGLIVVHYTLELKDIVVGQRYDSCLTDICLDDLQDNKEKIIQEVKNIDGQLIIKEYPTKSATTNTIRSHLEKLKRQGIVPDMIIVDYADLLRPLSGRKEKRDELESIYEELRAIAQEQNSALWTASQTNRCFWVETKLSISRDGKSQIIRIGDIKKGDLVETHVGLRKVAEIFSKKTQQVYKITLKSGKTMICSANHKFPVSGGDLKSINTGLSMSDKLLVKK